MAIERALEEPGVAEAVDPPEVLLAFERRGGGPPRPRSMFLDKIGRSAVVAQFGGGPRLTRPRFPVLLRPMKASVPPR